MSTTRDPQYIDLLRRYRAAGGVDLREQLHARYLELQRGGTTPGGLPYPDPTDPVAEGADAIRALAERIRFCGGIVSVPGSGGANHSTVPIVFPAGLFTSPPLVLAGSTGNATGSTLIASALNITTAGASIRLTLNTGLSWSTVFPTQWFAIEMPS